MLSVAPPVIFSVEAHNRHDTWYPDIVLADETFAKVGDDFQWANSLDYGRTTGVTTFSGGGDLSIVADDGDLEFHATSKWRVDHADGQTFFGDFNRQDASIAAYVLGPAGTPFTIQIQLDVDTLDEFNTSGTFQFDNGFSNHWFYGKEGSDTWNVSGTSIGQVITYAGETYSLVDVPSWGSYSSLRVGGAASGGYPAFTQWVEIDARVTMHVTRDLPDIAVEVVSLADDETYQVGYSLDVGRQQAIAPAFTAYWSSTQDKSGTIGAAIATWTGPLTGSGSYQIPLPLYSGLIAPVGSKYLLVVADDSGALVESDEDNNRAAIALQLPDIAVRAIKFNGDSDTIDVTYGVKSLAADAQVTLTAYWSRNGRDKIGSPIVTWNVDAQTGVDATAAIPLLHVAAPPATAKFLVVIADDGQILVEVDEGNNDKSITLPTLTLSLGGTRIFTLMDAINYTVTTTAPGIDLGGATYELEQRLLRNGAWVTVDESTSRTFVHVERLAGDQIEVRARMEFCGILFASPEKTKIVQFPMVGDIAQAPEVIEFIDMSWDSAKSYASRNPGMLTELSAYIVLDTSTGLYGYERFTFNAPYPPSPDGVHFYMPEIPDVLNGRSAIYVVSTFHTHPVLHYINDPILISGGGPSEGDIRNAYLVDKRPGIVHDYLDRLAAVNVPLDAPTATFVYKSEGETTGRRSLPMQRPRSLR